jgi:signal transduction histidine kinase
MLPANEEDERSSRPGEVVREPSIAVKNGSQPHHAMALLAHELRNPLNAIRMTLHMLRDGHDDASQRKHVDMLDRQTRHMSRLIEGVLDFSRIGRGKVQPNKQRVELAQLVEVAIEAVRPCIEERGHELAVTLPPGLVFLEADPTRLVEVLTNLLENAAKFTGAPGRIELTAAPEGNDIVVRVRDSGIGIAPEILPRIFDLFWQSSPEGAHSACGLGIGLALVRQLVELHGGSVSAFSAGLGQGSEFVIHLPRTTSAI